MKDKASKLETFVALLRGINVGGSSMVSMGGLKTLFEKAGYVNVRTYINSGNVVFQAEAQDPEKLEKSLEEALGKKYNFRPRALVRSFEQMQNINKNIPKDWGKGAAERRYNVLFLKNSIDSRKILHGLNPKPGIEEVVYYPGVLYWSANTSDLSRTSMLKLSAQAIYQEITVRNVNTAKKIFEVMEEVKALHA